MPIHEKALISQVRRRSRTPSKSVALGIGDDCAVLRVPPGHEVLVTTDFSLEGVHFRRDWHPPEVVGRRCLTRGLSDIAAMGGETRAVFLSLALERGVPQKWVERFLDGLLALARKFRVPLAGGDTAQSVSGIQADIVVVGSVPRGKAARRSGARPGEAVYVTGNMGGSAAAIDALRQGKIRSEDYERHFHPVPRVPVGAWLRQRGLASSMIDLSDGLSTDLAHVCEESRVGAKIEAEAIPRARVGRPKAAVSLELALHGGEDYELLFTSAKKIPARIAGVPVTKIGMITNRRGLFLIDERGRQQELADRGWEHFRD